MHSVYCSVTTILALYELRHVATLRGPSSRTEIYPLYSEDDRLRVQICWSRSGDSTMYEGMCITFVTYRPVYACGVHLSYIVNSKAFQ